MAEKSAESTKNICDSPADEIFRHIFRLFNAKKIPLVLIETKDLISGQRIYANQLKNQQQQHLNKKTTTTKTQQQQKQQQRQQEIPPPAMPTNMRFGVMGENVSVIIDEIVPEINSWCGQVEKVGVSGTKISVLKTEETIAEFVKFGGHAKNNNNVMKNKILTTNFVMVVKLTDDLANLPKNLKDVPIFHWRRLHLRVLHRRGVHGYR